MTSPARRFSLLTLGITLGLLCAIAPLNFLVDPYNRFGNNRLGIYISAEREAKPMLLRRWPHDALIIGNSHLALIPVKGLKGFRFFNAGFAGATSEEVYYFLRRHATLEKVVILGIDLGQCDSIEVKGDQFAPLGLADALGNVLSFETIRHSFNAITEHLAGHIGFIQPDGSADMTSWLKQFDKRTPEEKRALRERETKRMMSNADQFTAPVKGRLEYYKKIEEDLRRKGTRCVAVIPPMFGPVAEHIQRSPTFPAFQLWKRELRSIFPTVIDLSFSAYDAPENFYPADPAHFTCEVGEKMLNTEVIPTALALVAGPEAIPKIESGVHERH